MSAVKNMSKRNFGFIKSNLENWSRFLGTIASGTGNLLTFIKNHYIYEVSLLWVNRWSAIDTIYDVVLFSLCFSTQLITTSAL